MTAAGLGPWGILLVGTHIGTLLLPEELRQPLAALRARVGVQQQDSTDLGLIHLIWDLAQGPDEGLEAGEEPLVLCADKLQHQLDVPLEVDRS
uniref:Uncharacterized protein n=1 Tax=Eutreptiella gymnastica TaxID=73025 RepID=A0A7S1IUT5_9EUGL